MSSAGLGSTTTLLGGSPSGQAAGHVNNQTQFTLVLGGGGMKGVAHVGVLQALTERGLVPSQIVGSSVGAPVPVRVDGRRCTGCGAVLVQAPPGMFVLDAEGKAVVTRPDQKWSPIDGEFIRHCPTYAISARPAAEPKAAGAAGYL